MRMIFYQKSWRKQIQLWMQRILEKDRCCLIALYQIIQGDLGKSTEIRHRFVSSHGRCQYDETRNVGRSPAL